jgi:serine/threonine-protein kinase
VDEPADFPRLVGRYALYDEVASGGMATVYLGRLIGPVGFSRTVAIKRLHPHHAKDPGFVAMFLDEARLAARIRHPNVVPTLDIVTVAGELFLVMEYVQGATLSRLRKSASERGLAIPPRVATSILCGALHGLHGAHEATNDRGESLAIVHRDVSPQNILVGLDGIPRILDFGVAKAVGRSQTTRDGAIKGKLAYMAPEQLEGKVTRRTDVFAASIVLWEVLTGERLFAGDEHEIIGQILKPRSPTPPSVHLRRMGTTLSARELGRLDEVTLRGLERNPRNRFQTAREMALALERCIGIASPAEVGEWIESLEGDFLSDRARQVARIESDSIRLYAPSPEAERPAPTQAALPLPPLQSSISTDDLSVVSLATVTAPAAKGAKGRRYGLVFALVSLTALGLAAVVGVRLEASLSNKTPRDLAGPGEGAGRDASGAPEPPAAQLTTTLSASAAASVPAAAGSSPRTASAPAELASSSASSSASLNRAVSPNRGHGSRGSPPPPPSQGSPTCDPPYVDDAIGRHYKRECL